MIAFHHWEEWARSGAAEPDLDVGAFLVARDAYPSLTVAAGLGRLDALAAGLPEDLSALSPEDATDALLRYLYAQLGFRGNEEDYGDPRNSYLNDVLDRKLGIPISLAIVLLAVARRRGLRANGISFPGHFLVRVERARGGPLVVDPFYGRTLSLQGLASLLKKTAGPRAKLQLEHLKPAGSRAILVRVLQNLKASHLARGDVPGALVSAARIVTLLPKEPWALRDRGMLQSQLGAPVGARADLLRYLELAPDASDAAAIRQTLARLSARGSNLN